MLRVLAVNPAAPREDKLAQAVELLAAGGVIALATDTVYGLAADASNLPALRRLNRLKNKVGESPILLLLADPEQARLVSGDLPARKL